MSNTQIPSRARPEDLQQVCKHLQSSGRMKKSILYDGMDLDRRKIRAALDYGDKLGFVDFDGNTAKIDNLGVVLAFNEFGENALEQAFRDAIEQFKPYRETLLRIHTDDMVEEIKGDQCVTQSTLQDCLEAITGEEQSTREVNLLIKTAEQAGLGEFITGRRGKETRLKLSKKFGEYIQKLIEEYGEAEITEQDQQSGIKEDNDANIDTHESSTPNSATDIDSGSVSITVELDVSAKDNEEILDIIRDIRLMGGD